MSATVQKLIPRLHQLPVSLRRTGFQDQQHLLSSVPQLIHCDATGFFSHFVHNISTDDKIRFLCDRLYHQILFLPGCLTQHIRFRLFHQTAAQASHRRFPFQADDLRKRWYQLRCRPGRST